MARRITYRMSLLPLLLLMLVCCGGCYHRQVLPAMTICVRDPQDRPLPGLSGEWSGYASEGNVTRRPFAFDPDGCARVARYDIQGNILSLFGAALTSLLPDHLRFGPALQSTTTDVYVSLPEGYEVDDAASGLKRTGETGSGGRPEWEGRDDMTFYVDLRDVTLLWQPDGRRVLAFPGQLKPPDQFVISLWKPGSRPAVDVRLVLRPKAAANPRGAAAAPATRPAPH